MSAKGGLVFDFARSPEVVLIYEGSRLYLYRDVTVLLPG
jgi:hypothetical protein